MTKRTLLLRPFAAALRAVWAPGIPGFLFPGQTTVAPHCHNAIAPARLLPILGHLNGLDKRAAAAAAVSVPYRCHMVVTAAAVGLLVRPSRRLVRWPPMPRNFSALQSGAYDNAQTAATADCRPLLVLFLGTAPSPWSADTAACKFVIVVAEGDRGRDDEKENALKGKLRRSLRSMPEWATEIHMCVRGGRGSIIE